MQPLIAPISNATAPAGTALAVLHGLPTPAAAPPRSGAVVPWLDAGMHTLRLLRGEAGAVDGFRPSEAATPPGLPSVDQAMVLQQTPEQLLRQFTAIITSAPIARLPDAPALLARWRESVLGSLRRAGVVEPLVRDLESAFTAMQDASHLLDKRLRWAFARLQAPAVVQQLEAAGVTVAQVEAQLYLRANEILERLQAHALRRRVVFPLVPRQQDLLGMALRAAAREARAIAADLAGGPWRSEDDGPAGLRRTDTAMPLVRPPVDLPPPRIANRQQALEALTAFEANYRTSLPQLASGQVQDAVDLSVGVVDFAQVGDMVVSFPCAVRIGSELPADRIHPRRQNNAPGRVQVSYPRGEGLFSTIRKPMLKRQDAVVARGVDPSQVRYRLAGLQWTPTEVYTDAVVERAKVAMWVRIFHHAFRVAVLLPAEGAAAP